jgi:hypothetical protein
VQVLHDPQQRRRRGQPFDQAQQQLEQPPLTGLAGTRGTGAGGGRLATPGKVGQQPAQLLPGRAGDHLQLGRVQLVGQAPQRLDHRRERQPLLAQRHAPTNQHAGALPLRCRGQLLDQPGLAHPGLPAQQRRAVGGTRQELAQPRQLLGAADEAARGDLVGHVGPVCRCAAAEQGGRDLKIPGSGSEDPG